MISWAIFDLDQGAEASRRREREQWELHRRLTCEVDTATLWALYGGDENSEESEKGGHGAAFDPAPLFWELPLPSLRWQRSVWEWSAVLLLIFAAIVTFYPLVWAVQNYCYERSRPLSLDALAHVCFPWVGLCPTPREHARLQFFRVA